MVALFEGSNLLKIGPNHSMTYRRPWPQESEATERPMAAPVDGAAAASSFSFRTDLQRLFLLVISMQMEGAESSCSLCMG